MHKRLAIFCDYPEEDWPSMDLVAAMLAEELARRHGDRFSVRALCPPFKRRASLVPVLGSRPRPFLFDRLVNRLHDYPRYVRQVRDAFDLYHIADHSYAALVHALPAGRCGVFCHDLDAFAAALDPVRHARPAWYRALVRHVLRGMQRAAVVFHPTLAVRAQIERLNLVDPHRLVHAPLGVAEEFVPWDQAATIPAAVERAGARPFILHVGSCAPRKRVDVALEVLGALQRQRPAMRLVKVGGEFSEPLRGLIDRLGIAESIVHLRGIDRLALAWLYRRAALVLMPSSAEGFGLPTIEALACGAPVLASDIPPLREVGGDATDYCPVGDIAAWSAAAERVLASTQTPARRPQRIEHARRFTWSRHAQIIADAYERLT